MPDRKVVIIGLDGADWRILQPEIEAGRLPVLAKLQAEGSYGPLHSTIRPESSVAWSTFATGVNPGKHGIFGFVRHQPNSYHFSLADSRHIAVRRFWDYLGAAGHRVGLVNIPFTYPPLEVNGFLIGGMLTPGVYVTFTHPPQLQKNLLARCQPYLFDAGDGKQEKTAVAGRVSAYTDQQLSVACWLLQEEAWDCFTLVFTGLDRLQHFLWDEPVHRRYLQQLDAALGSIVAMLPPETIVLLISDHGFNGVARRFYVNRWLQQEGYLTLRTGHVTVPLLENWLSWLKKVPFAQRFKQRLLPADWGPTQLKTAIFTQPINWPQTRVYYAPDGGLRINLQGREPQGIVPPGEYESLRQALTAKLLDLRDPVNGHPPIAHVYPREALYNGPYAGQAPDLIVEPQRNAATINHNYLIDSKLDAPTAVFASAHPYTGNHAPTGIMLAWRPGMIAQQKISGCQLQDVAPTVLAALDTPIPNQMDGRVLQELFTPGHRPQPTFVTDNDFTQPITADKQPEDETTAVADRLRNLGYLD